MGPCQRRRLMALAAILILGGCGGSNGPQSCPDDVPSACPNPAPSYAAQVAPLLKRLCGGCHTAGGVEAKTSFDTLGQVQMQRGHILSQLHGCLMPPADQTQATPDERQTIFGWIVCGATNN